MESDVPPMDMGLLEQFFEAFRATYGEAGAVGGMAVVVLFAIRVFQTDFVQSLVPLAVRWTAWPQWAKWAAPFVLALAGTLIIELRAGEGLWAAVATAFAAAVAAVGSHHATKAIGHAEQGARLQGNILYQPGKTRRAASILVPLRPKDHYARKIHH